MAGVRMVLQDVVYLSMFPCFIFLHRAEVGARNPVTCQLDQVVVDGLDNDRH